jgi:WD40 repeat protein/transcriptional regulator with XRE-family HTH domain
MQNKSSYRSLDYEFGILIQSLRQKTGLTQTALADLVGVSKRAVLNWEAGDSYPQISRLRRLVEVFLEKACFTAGQEKEEAYLFWEKATPTKTDVKDAFNPEWFYALLNEKTGVTRPLSLYQNQTRQDWSEAPGNRILYGRDTELNELETWVIQDRQKVINLLGIGGIGKTTLAVALAHRLSPQFDYVIFRSLRNAPLLEELLDSLLHFFQHGQFPTAHSEKISLVMDYLRTQRCLIVLDNAETIMQKGLSAGEFGESYTGYADFIRQLSELPHQSCILITSREKPQILSSYEEKSGAVRSLTLKGLDKKACQAILTGMNIDSNEEHGTILTGHYGGNPLALKLIAEPIREIFGGDTTAFLRAENTKFGGVAYILDQHFERLSPVEQDIMYWLAISGEPLDLETIQKRSVLGEGLNTYSAGLKALFKRFLIERSEDKQSFILQNVVVEYVLERLLNQLHGEIIEQKPDLLHRYRLLQTQMRESGRQTRLRLIFTPLLNELEITLKRAEVVAEYLKKLLKHLRNLPPEKQAYAPANLLNLLVQLNFELKDLDLSGLNLGQAYLSGVELVNSDLTGSDLSGAIFSEAFLSAYSLAYSPDGKTLAIGCANGSVKIWEAEDSFGRQLLECREHTNLVVAVAFNPDGTLLASASSDGTIRLWEVISGNCLAVLNGHTAPVRAIVFSPNGKWLVSGGEDQIICWWQVSNARLITKITGHEGWVMTVAFSPDGKTLASAGYDATIKLWDVTLPEKEIKLTATLRGHKGWISSVTFSPDSNWLASGGADHTVRIWSVKDQISIKKLEGHSGAVLTLAFSPAGHLLASGGVDSTIRLWTTDNFQSQKQIVSGDGVINALVFNPKGETLVSSSSEVSNLKLWSLKSPDEVDVLQGYTQLVYTMSVKPDGQKLVAAGTDARLFVWDLSSRPIPAAPLVLKGHTSSSWAVAFSPDGKLLASGSGDTTIKLWNSDSGLCWRTLKGHNKTVMVLVFSPDNKLLISGDESGTLKLWSLLTGENLISIASHQNRLRTLIFSPDDKFLATGADDGFIQLWEINADNSNLNRLASWHSDAPTVASLAFNFDGKLLYSGGSDGIIRCWDIVTKQSIAAIPAHSSLIWAIAYNARAKKLATAGEDNFVQLWDTQKNALLTSFALPTKVLAVAFTPDGKYLFSAGEQGKINLWELESNTLVTTLNPRLPYAGLNISKVTGLTHAQHLNLLNLGAIEN